MQQHTPPYSHPHPLHNQQKIIRSCRSTTKTARPDAFIYAPTRKAGSNILLFTGPRPYDPAGCKYPWTGALRDGRSGHNRAPEQTD